MKFQSNVLSFSENSLMYEYYIPIPDRVFDTMIQLVPDKRVRCVFNDLLEHYCAMSPKGDFHYILLNKSIMKKMGWKHGDTVWVDIDKHELKYGIPICRELEDVLANDEEGNVCFHSLTMGNQRSLIHLINKYKNPQLRLDRSIILLRHLVLREGHLDFKILQANFKEGL